ncbi:hypothetical protein IHQ72_11445 [Mesorhizobium onobrychidis]|uniref:Uncharacterized protein n=1 Tax=Mesorhizobium onobrychidis TaxID=2775404 RepID=A0ABY5R2D3_9HYPH|nr:hypothetical protein IHQ72_11445 [Mesorhizobium onobrychidis]
MPDRAGPVERGKVDAKKLAVPVAKTRSKKQVPLMPFSTDRQVVLTV